MFKLMKKGSNSIYHKETNYAFNDYTKYAQRKPSSPN